MAPERDFMSRDFDPYHVWLGIPPGEQPPSYYRLLSLRPFEPAAGVIDHAYQRTTVHLRTLIEGPQGARARELLEEVASAAECLLDPLQKMQYDQTLVQEINARRAASAAPSPVTAVPVQATSPLANVAVTQRPVATTRARQQRAGDAPAVLQMIKLFGGGVLGLALGYLAVYFALGRDFLGLLPSLSEPVANAPVVAAKPSEPKRQAALPPTDAPPTNQIQATPDSPPPELPTVPPADLPVARPAEPPVTTPSPEQSRPAPAPQKTAVSPAPNIASDANKKLPQPTAEARQKMLAELQEMYQAEFDRANRPEGRAPLVAFLLDTARKLKADTAAQYVLYREAYDRAQRLEDFTTVAVVIDELERTFDVDGYRLRLHLLTEASKAARTPAERQPLVEFALQLAEYADDTDRLDDLGKLLNIVEGQMRFFTREARAAFASRLSELRKMAEEFTPVAAARERLIRDPANQAAALLDGRYRCFVRGEWEAGLALLAESDHAALAAAAQRDLAGATTYAARAKIADLWFDLGTADPALLGSLARARYWYELARKEAPALEQVKYERRLEQIGASKLPPRLLDRPQSGDPKLPSASELLAGRPVAG